MYQLYLDNCTEDSQVPVALRKYRSIFCEEFDLSFFTPKKDQCLICAKYAKADLEQRKNLEIIYEEHRKRNEICQAAKRIDKDKANKDKANKDKTFMSVTLDLQAIL
ncbi:unnamed protein product [Diabrotica balteata]|uniref:Uncharacterized protein n=1 Tax=Diabrotica balteata TaxID=107213 RepID=A0A9N9SR85_DIABA|nr:unnamed protein product [Diabrotica balteata]